MSEFTWSAAHLRKKRVDTSLQRERQCAAVAFTFHKRTFLNPEPSTHTSYVLAEVESGQWGTNLLIIADCKRSIQLEFFVGNDAGRTESLAKINLLIDVLSGFRDALQNEADLISKQD